MHCCQRSPTSNFQSILTNPLLAYACPNTHSAIKALPATAPILLILPGVVGKSDNAYVKRLALAAVSHGWRPVAKSYRGIGVEMRDALPETWSHRTVLDLDAAVEHIRERYPGAVICGAGFSFGGMQLLSYLGARQDSPIAAGISLSGMRELVNSVSACVS